MTITMNKELLIRIPLSLYTRIKGISKDEYKSLSGLVRELLLEKVQETLGEEELKTIEIESKSFHKSGGTEWRKVKRG